MGAPKQKWTAEEESALKAGVKKHGIGKWRNILRDPEFSMDLRSRSNIDLKDKWRNMTVTGSGWVSRERASSKSRRLSKSKKLKEDEEYNPMAVSTKLEEDMVIDATPIATSSVPHQVELGETKKQLKRLDNHILEAITQLQECCGSNKTAIAMYIKERYQLPPDFQSLLSAKLKALVESGKLIKVNRNYKKAPSSIASPERKPRLPPTPRPQNGDTRKPSMTQADDDLAAMREVTTQEAADSAARAVVESELAGAEAEEAIRKAETVEAQAQAAQAFVEAVILHFKNRNSASLMIQT